MKADNQSDKKLISIKAPIQSIFEHTQQKEKPKQTTQLGTCSVLRTFNVTLIRASILMYSKYKNNHE